MCLTPNPSHVCKSSIYLWHIPETLPCEEDVVNVRLERHVEGQRILVGDAFPHIEQLVVHAWKGDRGVNNLSSLSKRSNYEIMPNHCGMQGAPVRDQSAS